jgi:tol-pal system protein YbgF
MRRALPAVFALALGACAKESVEDRSIKKLQDELATVQTQNERMAERLSTLEVEQANAKDDKKKTTGPTPAPPLRVVHLGTPDGSDAKPDDTEDLNPRPTIKIQGTRAKGAPNVIEQTMPDETQTNPSGPRPSALDPKAREAYDAALALVNAKQYDRALEAFSGFLVRWPDHPYADNATYWRGECYFAKGEYSHALEQFDGLIARFPLGNKAPDAHLKAGISQQKLGNPSKAAVYFDKLRRDFPKSDAAKRIPVSGPSSMGPQVAP